jgi:hypothetical protein
VAPGETAHVKLVLVAQSDFTPDLQHCRDRFLVQSLPILPGQQPDSNAFKAQKFKVQDHKLRVSIVSPLSFIFDPAVHQHLGFKFSRAQHSMVTGASSCVIASGHGNP